jgi:hypothetical protein
MQIRTRILMSFISALLMSFACRSVTSELVVANNSRETIAAVVIVVGGQEFDLPGIKVGEEITRRFAVRKEGGFSITVRYESGRTTRKEVGYVTPAIGADHRLTISDADVEIATTIRK